MRQKRNNESSSGRSRGKKFFSAAVLIAAVVVIALLAYFKSSSSVSSEDISAEPESQAMEMTVEWKGGTYTYNTNLTNILFMGVDITDPIEKETTPGEAGQADCIILFSLDKETKQATILQINRNTVVSLDVSDFTGNYLKSIEGQICLQYGYSIGGNYSCRAVRDKVSELLYGVTIDGYFTMEVAGVAEINDALGGVDVTLTQDWTEIDESFTEGSTVHLEGELAEAFVRYRDTSEFNSVQGRMERQTQYVTALIGQMSAQGGIDLYDTISPYIGDYILTDMDDSEINALATYEYLTDDVQYLPGEETVGDDGYEEFHTDSDELQDLVIRMFYTEVTENGE
ncbi:MAG: LCP family protein [Clostridiales bacterium]|nr:LCP family protein [Clostridiales bacterium]